MPLLTIGAKERTVVELYYEDHGAGRPVVLIHGLLQDGRSWEPQRVALLDAGYRVITYDRRGFGRSGRPTADYDFGTLTADLDALLTHLGLTDVVLVGFSLGTGEVARYLALHGSARVTKAVMIGAIPPFLLDRLPASVFNYMKASLVADRHAFIRDFMHDVFNFDHFGGTRITDQDWQKFLSTAASASEYATSACIDAGLTDFRADIRAIDVPTLVVHGTADRILPIDATARRLPELNNHAMVVEIDGAPHGLAWTHPEEVNKAIFAFLKIDRELKGLIVGRTR
jgi:non-heme chloroperoxidase